MKISKPRFSKYNFHGRWSEAFGGFEVVYGPKLKLVQCEAGGKTLNIWRVIYYTKTGAWWHIDLDLR